LFLRESETNYYDERGSEDTAVVSEGRKEGRKKGRKEGPEKRVRWRGGKKHLIHQRD
jgi:hypothetical protein